MEGFRGAPAAFKTAPPVPEKLVAIIQSPILVEGVFAISSPSMLKPPAGANTGATPRGGGVACPDPVQSNARAKAMRRLLPKPREPDPIQVVRCMSVLICIILRQTGRGAEWEGVPLAGTVRLRVEGSEDY